MQCGPVQFHCWMRVNQWPGNSPKCFAKPSLVVASLRLSGPCLQLLSQPQGLPVCVVQGNASQFFPCGGESCSMSIANFTQGCQFIGGFVSGAGDTPICALPTSYTQFTACPPGTSVCSELVRFEDACIALGGFVDGYLGPSFSQPECTVKGSLSWVYPCGGPGSCTYSQSDFAAGEIPVGGQPF
jgi:hypothetical protein